MEETKPPKRPSQPSNRPSQLLKSPRQPPETIKPAAQTDQANHRRAEMDPVQFDQLPYLCLKKIFSFLNLRDLTKCRAVSRHFKAYAEEIGVDELVVGEDSAWYQCQSWYQTHRPIDHEYSISPKAFVSSLESSPFKLNQQLKFLHLHSYYRAVISTKILNEFNQLQHLELRGTAFDPSEPLILPNLKVLDVWSFIGDSFVLKAPKLEVLASADISSFRIEHPKTIKQIEFDCEWGVTGLTSFENLQILICNCFDGHVPNGIRLSDWKGLRELQICPISWRIGSAFEVLQHLVANLIRQRAESKREDLKLYLDEVLLVDVKQFEDYRAVFANQDADPIARFRMKNYQLLRCDTYPNVTYPNVTSVNFNSLMKLDVQLSSDFFDRFPRIRSLTASGSVDRDRFEWFLQYAPAVRELILTNTSLDFMNRLLQINNRLISLKVYESPDLTADLNFVLQLKQLTEFATDCELASLDFVAEAFRRLNELQSFHFRAGDKCVQIGHASLKNVYYLSFVSVRRGVQTFARENLDWAQLVVLYFATSPMSDEDDFY